MNILITVLENKQHSEVATLFFFIFMITLVMSPLLEYFMCLVQDSEVAALIFFDNN